jgi:hypothetical protein
MFVVTCFICVVLYGFCCEQEPCFKAFNLLALERRVSRLKGCEQLARFGCVSCRPVDVHAYTCMHIQHARAHTHTHTHTQAPFSS